MSKLIVEMEMPRGCYFCPMAEPHPTYWFCRAFDDTTQIDGCAPMDKRRSWCPIKGVLPDEHGDLIDRDEIVTAYAICDGTEAMELVKEAAVIIAAERTEERKNDEQIH